MKETIIVISCIIGVLLTLAFPIYAIETLVCNDIGNQMGKESTYRFISGCYIKDGYGQWVREERYRNIN